MQDVALVLQMPQYAQPGMYRFVVPALRVHRVRTKHLQLTRVDLGGQDRNHSPVFILEELSHRGGEDQERRAAMSEDQRFHVTMEFLAISFVIFTVHFRDASWPKYLTRFCAIGVKLPKPLGLERARLPAAPLSSSKRLTAWLEAMLFQNF